MPYVLLDVNQVVVAHNDGPANGYVQAPDHVTKGHQLNGETWEKSAALLAEETAAADLATKKANVSNSIATVRTWVDFAKDTVVAGWDASTTAQKLIWMKQHIDRDGTVWSRLADLVEGHKLH